MPPRKCKHCRQPGHYISTCPVLKKIGKRKQTCRICGQPGHNRGTCPQRDDSTASGKRAGRPRKAEIDKKAQRRLTRVLNPHYDKSGNRVSATGGGLPGFAERTAERDADLSVVGFQFQPAQHECKKFPGRRGVHTIRAHQGFAKMPVVRRVEPSAGALQRAFEYAERQQRQTTESLERTAAEYYARRPAEETILPLPNAETQSGRESRGFMRTPATTQPLVQPNPATHSSSKLEFTRPDNTEIRVVARPPIIPQTIPSANAVLTTLRCDTITTGRLAVAAADAGDMDAAHAAIGGLIERFSPVGVGTKEDESARASLLLLQSDVEGRLSKALSRKERFERWGKHYLRALLRAHQLQLQTNFMDPGLKNYGGALFAKVRDAGGLIFAALPAPQPPPKTCPICGDAFGLDCTAAEMQRHTESHFGGPPAPAAPVRRTRVVRAQTRAPNMANFYEGEGGGCFGRGSTCMVCSVNSTDFVQTDVAAVQQGDFIRVAGGGTAEVVAAVTIEEPAEATLCELPSGLRITAKHPVRINGQWQMPTALPEARIVRNSSGFVTNFILRGDDGRLHDHGHVLLVDGVECASWGHGLKSEGIAHQFWGSERVIKALANCDTDAGRIVVRGCMRSGNGEVVGFVA